MAHSKRRFLLGVVLILAVAASFATNSTLAAIAYADGATALSVLTYRKFAAAAVLFVIIRMWRVPLYLPPQKRRAALAMGLLLGAYSYGLLGAIEHIPVALAVLTFYLYPLFVGFGAWVTGRERMTFRLAVALITAFIGLGLALDITGAGLNMTGIALAAGGAALNAVLVLTNSRLVGSTDSRPVSFHMLITATLFYVVIDIFVGDFPLPRTPLGYAAFFGVGAFYSFSIIGFFIAVSWIGSVRTSLLMNFEPVASMFLGIIVLGQFLEPSQYLGAALVVGAILFSMWGKSDNKSFKG